MRKTLRKISVKQRNKEGGTVEISGKAKSPNPGKGLIVGKNGDKGMFSA